MLRLRLLSWGHEPSTAQLKGFGLRAPAGEDWSITSPASLYKTLIGSGLSSLLGLAPLFFQSASCLLATTLAFGSTPTWGPCSAGFIRSSFFDTSLSSFFLTMWLLHGHFYTLRYKIVSRQLGHVGDCSFFVIHGLIHFEWNTWLQGNDITFWFLTYDSRHIEHSFWICSSSSDVTFLIRSRDLFLVVWHFVHIALVISMIPRALQKLIKINRERR